MNSLENIKTCKKCKTLFTDIIGKGICPNCKKHLEGTLRDIKMYVKENQDTRITEVSKQFDVPLNQLLNWVQEGELELTKNSDIKLFCRQCNTQIYTGVYCDKCKNNLMRGFKDNHIIEEPIERLTKEDRDVKMRFLKKNNF